MQAYIERRIVSFNFSLIVEEECSSNLNRTKVGKPLEMYTLSTLRAAVSLCNQPGKVADGKLICISRVALCSFVIASHHWAIRSVARNSLERVDVSHLRKSRGNRTVGDAIKRNLICPRKRAGLRSIQITHGEFSVEFKLDGKPTEEYSLFVREIFW